MIFVLKHRQMKKVYSLLQVMLITLSALWNFCINITMNFWVFNAPSYINVYGLDSIKDLSNIPEYVTPDDNINC